jgi:L-malate glycosyltransferase
MRLVLIGDGESPHLLKWARALAQTPGVELWAASSRGFAPGFDACIPAARCLALQTRPARAGGNLSVLFALPRLAAWLRRVDADWLHAHYLTSHGSLAWLSKRGWRLRARIAGSAWGSDVLVAPKHLAYRWLTRRVLRACALTTSDSRHMAERMRELGAHEVMTFPLEALPPPSPPKEAWLFFTNRALEPLYRPLRALTAFVQVARVVPEARLVVANRGAMLHVLQREAKAAGLRVGSLGEGAQVEFTGLLDADAQAAWYDRARWYLSLPASDSVSVSVLEAMAHGCIPVLSDLPANRELVRHGDNGLILGTELTGPCIDDLRALQTRANEIEAANRNWVDAHARFSPAVVRFVARLREIDAANTA